MIEGKELIEFQGSARDMEYRLAEMQKELDIVQKFFQKMMIQGRDYGIIPGTDKPTLLKPGAEKLCNLYNLAPLIKDVKEEKNSSIGFCHYVVIMSFVDKQTGTIVAEGVGEANTDEDQFKWRWVPDWKLPEGINTDTLEVRTGTTKDKREYRLYRMENKSLPSLWNTVLKRAKKRAFIDGTLTATRTSGIFTQDMEDLQDWIDEIIEDDEVETITSTEQYNPQKITTTTPATKKSTKTITEAQTRLLYGRAKSKNLSNEALHQMIKELVGKDSVKDLSMQDLDVILNAIQQM